MENQRLFMAIALSVLVIAVSQVLFPPPKAPPRPPPSSSAAAAPATGAPAPLAVDAVGLPTGTGGESIEVRTSLYRARLGTLGAVVTSMELLQYPETQKPDSPPVDLVQRHSPTRGLFWVDLLSGSQRVSTSGVIFHTDQRVLDVAPGATGELVFRGEYPGWARIEKTFRFTDGRYDVDVETRVIPDPGTKIDRALLSLSDSREVTGSSRQDQLRARVSWGLDRVHMDSLSVPDLRSEVRKGKHTPRVFDDAHGKGAVRWGGFDERYFLLAILPDLASGAGALINAFPDSRVQLDVMFPLSASAGETGGALLKARAFGGPKDLQVLRSTETTLDSVLDYGRFALLSRAFVSILRFFHQFTGNWGFAIIMLTLAVRLVLLPLNVSSFRSMKKMQALQPEMTQLREKYKEDPMKMQQEMGALYKRHNVNPLGGCLPMLLQFPVFLGLYYALAQAIELRHAHFAFWINDLSERDPYYVTPIIMGATMFVQQLLTPVAGDPAQQKMMRLMPVIFTVSFLNFPSGLVLYWLFSNLVGIASQWYIKRSPA